VGACRAPSKGVEEHSDGEGQDRLGDSNIEPGRSLGEVVLERIWPWRFEKSLSITSLVEAKSAFAADVFGGTGSVAGEQADAVGRESLFEGAAHKPLSATTTWAETPVRRSASGSYSFSRSPARSCSRAAAPDGRSAAPTGHRTRIGAAIRRSIRSVGWIGSRLC
jgi:hypothetical protein